METLFEFPLVNHVFMETIFIFKYSSQIKLQLDFVPSNLFPTWPRDILVVVPGHLTFLLESRDSPFSPGSCLSSLLSQAALFPW